MSLGMAGRPKRKARMIAAGTWKVPERSTSKSSSKRKSTSRSSAAHGVPATVSAWMNDSSWDLDPYGAEDGDTSGQADLEAGEYTLSVVGTGDGLEADIHKMGKHVRTEGLTNVGSRNKREVNAWLKQQLDTFHKLATGRQVGGFLAGMF